MKQQRGRQSSLMRDWHQRLSVVLVGLFLLQIILWIEKEEALWLPETVGLVKLTLLATITLELFRRLPAALRCLLQAAFLIAATAYILDYVPVGREITKLRDVGLLLYDNYIQLAPFIWFVLSAWAITLIAITVMQTKRYVILILVATVVAFAIRDSIGDLDLWKQVAAVIFSGLLLAVICHFAELKKDNPAGWLQISRYVPWVALPVALLVPLVIFLGTLAPAIRPVLTDPYTMWNKLQGHPFLANGHNSAIFAFGGQSMSGYSRDDSSLGGQLSFDYTPVMIVNASQPGYWRGESRSLYNGEGWALSDAERRTPLSSISAGVPFPQDPAADSTRLQTMEVAQTITMTDLGKEFPVLFGAYAIHRIESVTDTRADAGFTSLQWSVRLSELRWTGNGRNTYPVSYTLTSKVPIVDVASLRKLPAELSALAGFEEYLQLPESLPARVRELASRVTQSGTNLYDKTKLLEQYLASTFPYTSTPDLSKGQSPDFVDRFLFEIQEGYCDYYSTAMVVMARSIGIPARWVKGYGTGETSGEGEYTVRNSDAHSWVEVYFPGYGWLQFEPTSGFTLPAVLADDKAVSEPLPETTTEPEQPSEEKMSTEPEAVLPETPKNSLSQIVIWGAGIAVIILASIWVNRRRIPALNRIWPELDTNQRTVLEFNRFLRFAKKKGYSRLEHETVREAVGRWGAQDKWMEKEELESLLLLFEKAKYSGLRISDEELSEVSQKVREIKLG